MEVEGIAEVYSSWKVEGTGDQDELERDVVVVAGIGIL